MIHYKSVPATLIPADRLEVAPIRGIHCVLAYVRHVYMYGTCIVPLYIA